MQTYTDPSLTETKLPTLAQLLKLPNGWEFNDVLTQGPGLGVVFRF